MKDVTLYRLEEFSQRPGVPGWIRRTERGNGKPCKPIVRCECGRLVGLVHHRIAADGVVTASFEHRRGHDFGAGEDPGGCGWHVRLRLADYHDGEFAPGG